MLIGLLLASTIFFGMAAGDADDKKIEQLEKAIAAAETKEERDKLFTQLNALLEPQKPNKKPNAVPKLAKGDDKQEWDIGMVRVTHDGGFELTIWREQNLEAGKRARTNGDLHNLGKHVYNGWPPGWEPVSATTEGVKRIWDVRKRIK